MAEHSHLIDFPEALEAFFSRVGELKAALGPKGAPGVAAVEAVIAEGLAARDRGDVRTAVARLVDAMERVATLASDAGAPDGPMLRMMAAQFRAAVGRGDLSQARGAADVMREQSGSAIHPKKR